MNESLIPSAMPPISAARLTLDGMVAKGRADSGATRTLRCRTIARGRVRQRNSMRYLAPQRIMQHESKGVLAETTAPGASETRLAALGSRLAVGIRTNAIARRSHSGSLELGTEADINIKALWRAGNLHLGTFGLETNRVLVRMEADAPRDTLPALVEQATLWSPVVDTTDNPVRVDASFRP